MDFFYLHPVTYLYSGNNPANGLVTEILQYFSIFCFFRKWQNGENQLILNRLCFICAVLFGLALGEITYVARHTFATTIALTKGVPIETVSKMLGHTSIKTTEIYAKVINDKISNDMDLLAEKLNGIETKFAVNF